MTRRIADSLNLMLYCGLIYTLSAQSKLPAPVLFSFQDKIIHAVAYGVMGWLCWRAFSHFLHNRNHLILASLGFCSAYGFSDELHQYFVPGRHADAFDWIADTIGAFTGIMLKARIRKDSAP